MQKSVETEYDSTTPIGYSVTSESYIDDIRSSSCGTEYDIDHGHGQRHDCKPDRDIPIIVDPGNDVLIAIKLHSSDDKGVIDVDTDDIKHLKVLVDETPVECWSDLSSYNLIHAKIESEVISKPKKYDITVVGVWNGINVTYTFHSKLVVTRERYADHERSIKHNVNSQEHFAGNAVFIPAPRTYMKEEELRKLMCEYHHAKKAAEAEKERALEIADQLLPDLNDKVEMVSEKMSHLDGQVETVANEVAEVKKDVSILPELNENFKKVIADVSVLPELINGVKNDVSVVKSDVAGVKADVADVKTDVAAVKSSVEEIGTKLDASLDEVIAREITIEGKIDDIASKMFDAPNYWNADVEL